MTNKPAVCVDFDGVLHSYKSGWCGTTIIPDEPVDGSVQWITELIDSGLRVVVSSSRARTCAGQEAIRNWLEDNEYPVSEMTITHSKVPALMYIDDRAHRFDGKHFPSANTVRTAEPWMRQAGGF